MTTTSSPHSASGDPDTLAPHSPETATARRDRLVITLLLISTFIVILNETIMGVATPRLIIDLEITAGAAQWLTSAFMLTMAVIIPITGFLLQRFTTRALFIAAMTFFSIGTLIAAVAPGFAVLLIARVVQAFGTAIMFPLLMTTVITLVPPATRGRMMGNISIVISVAPAIGPTLSGLILQSLDWRFMFILVLPIAIVALVVGAVLMKNVTTPTAGRIDALSVVLSAVGFGGLVYGLSTLATATGVVQRWMPIGVGVVGLVVFVLRQGRLQRSDSALLDLRTFRSRTFSFSVVMFAISMMALFGTIILLPIYTQTVLGVDALDAGLLLLPGGLTMGILAPFVGRVYDRIGPTALLVAGSVIVSSALWFMTSLTETSTFWLIMVAHIILSVGLGLIFTPLFTASLASLTPNLYSYGSATVGTIQQLAGAAGTALFVTLMTARASMLIAGGSDPISATASGVHSAFVVGAVISLFAIPAAFFVRKTELPESEAALVGH